MTPRSFARTGLIACLTLCAVFTACTKKSTDALVRINGSILTLDEFKKYVPESELSKLSDDNIKAFLDNWTEQEILYLEAMKKGIDKEDSVRLVITQYRKNLLAMEVVRREFGGSAVSELDVRNYFDQHNDEFLYAVKLGQIVLQNYELAARTLAEIKSGADFFKIAKERSLTRLENPSDPKVVTDYIPRGSLGDFAIEEQIFRMQPGELSGIIPYVQGTFLIVKMVDKKKMFSKVDINTYSSQIYNYLMSQKYQEFLRSYVDSLRTKYKITVDLAPLKK
jgi:peptidyl-prolyl cis-trans isomerase C